MADKSNGYLDDIGDDEGDDEVETVEAPTSDRMIASEREDRIPDPPEDDAPDDTPDDDGDADDPDDVDDKPEPEAKADSPDRPKGFVPEAALAEARNEIRESRKTQRQLEATLQRWLDGQAAQAEAAAKASEPAPEPAEEMPAEDDYVGQIEWLKRKVAADEQAKAESRAQWEQRQRQEQQAAQQRKQWDDAVGAVARYWNSKTSEDPTLASTWDALRVNVAQEFVEVNGIQNQQQLLDAVKDWENNIIADCYNHQKPIDEVVRRLAKVRNVTPAQIQQAAAEQNAKVEDKVDQPDQPRAENGQFKSEKEKAARIKEGQERNGSLSQASGVPVEKMTAKEFANMSEDEQHRFLSKISGNKNRKDIERELGFF